MISDLDDLPTVHLRIDLILSRKFIGERSTVPTPALAAARE
jgi:hypothetical protein